MNNWFDLLSFLLIVTVASILWGRVNRIGYSRFISSVVYFLMKYTQANTELIRGYLVWFIYMSAGLAAAAALLLAYQVDLPRYLALDRKYFVLVPVAFIAENALTGLMMQLLVLARPAMSIYLELTSILWIRYTLIMPSVMRVISPLGAAIAEEVFFRGTVFLVLIKHFPQTGALLSTVICTVLFVVQQVLQTDRRGQAWIMLIGSTSVSVVGCITILCTGSFLPTLLCHAAYACFYLQLGTSKNWGGVGSIAAMPMGNPNAQRSRLDSAYPDF